MHFFTKLLIAVVFCLFLNACQTLKPSSNRDSKELQPGRYAILQDSAPLGPVPAFFKSFVPKAEPLSPYGNPASYRVGGKTYYVMRSAKSYHARGLASWYAVKFHKQRTSSGEPYDMYALTAAHKTLPLPTYLKVRNLQNGRQIIVKVNDRGPFHQDRLIDLSYAAAVKLGIFPKGTAPVEIEAIHSFAQAQTQGGQYYVQVGAFQSYASANQWRQKVVNSYHGPVVLEHQSNRYFVRTGPYSNQQQSEQAKKQLSAHGFKGAFSVLR